MNITAFKINALPFCEGRFQLLLVSSTRYKKMPVAKRLMTAVTLTAKGRVVEITEGPTKTGASKAHISVITSLVKLNLRVYCSSEKAR